MLERIIIIGSLVVTLVSVVLTLIALRLEARRILISDKLRKGALKWKMEDALQYHKEDVIESNQWKIEAAQSHEEDVESNKLRGDALKQKIKDVLQLLQLMLQLKVEILAFKDLKKEDQDLKKEDVLQYQGYMQ